MILDLQPEGYDWWRPSDKIYTITNTMYTQLQLHSNMKLLKIKIL